VAASWLRDQTGGRDRSRDIACPGGAAIWSPGRRPAGCVRETLSQRLNEEWDELSVESDGGAVGAGPRPPLSLLSSFMSLL